MAMSLQAAGQDAQAFLIFGSLDGRQNSHGATLTHGAHKTQSASDL
jgi:hypothetical protein